MGRVQNPKKGSIDNNKSKIFMKLSKEIYVTALQGTDPNANTKLRLVIEKARTAGMPKDTIERAIKKASGTNQTENFTEIIYEGYGPDGVAIMVECLTDNRNRTASNIRATFGKNGGNLGDTGSVAYLFNRKGYLAIDRSKTTLSEDDVLMLALEAGAEDVLNNDYAFEVITDPTDFLSVKTELEKQTLPIIRTEISMLPTLYTHLPAENMSKLQKLIDILENDDDVQNVFHNAAEI